MINWYKDLYVGYNAKKKQRKLMRRAESGKLLPHVWLLLLPANPANNLDIIPADLLQMPYLKRQNPLVVGMAVSYDEALEVLREIAEDVYRQTGSLEIRAWFCGKLRGACQQQ